MAEASDDAFSFTRAPRENPRRVPAIVGIPVVIACVLVGYAVSLLAPMPHRPVPKPLATAAVPDAAEAKLPSSAAAATTSPAAKSDAAGRTDPAEVAPPKPPTSPVIETGSVEGRERPGSEGPKPAAAVPVLPGVPRAETQARPPLPRRPRYIYRRPVQKKLVGPLDSLWPTYPK